MVRDSEPSAKSKDPSHAGAEISSAGSSYRAVDSWWKPPEGSVVIAEFVGSFDYVALRYRARKLRSG